MSYFTTPAPVRHRGLGSTTNVKQSLMQYRVEFRVGVRWREDSQVCSTRGGAVRRANAMERRNENIDTRIVAI